MTQDEISDLISNISGYIKDDVKEFGIRSNECFHDLLDEILTKIRGMRCIDDYAVNKCMISKDSLGGDILKVEAAGFKNSNWYLMNFNVPLFVVAKDTRLTLEDLLK